MPQLNNDVGCTLTTCPLSYATIDYDPTLVGNTLFLAIFGLTWSFSCAVMSGLVLEIVGYVGRVQMHFNPFDANPFLIYLVCITAGPVFFSAAIYLVLSRIIVHYGVQHARISPKAISLTFMTCDFIGLLLQAVGGALADTADTKKGRARGTNIMVGDLGFQVVSLLLFVALAVEFALNVRRNRRAGRFLGETKENLGFNRESEGTFKFFLFGLSLATLFILTRSSFRVAELAKGFGSKLANEEVPFMVLEGAMIVLATLTLTSFHPGWAFGAKWTDAGWSWKKSCRSDVEAGRKTSSQPSSSLT